MATTARPGWPFVLAWAIFWVLMITMALRQHRDQGHLDWWRPLLWEGSSCLVSSVIVLWLWRGVPRLDALLGQPWRWFAKAASRLPAAAIMFVFVVYALRHGVYAMLGRRYEHPPWAEVLVYESLKFAMFYLLFMAVVFGLRSHAAMQALHLRAEEERGLARQAQLLQLAQQIQPHFLFNALNTIAATVHEDPDLADALLVKLSALLRAATDMAREPVRPLADEVALLQAYGEIMTQRFAERLTLSFEIDEDASACRVPTLLLQPLLENAFRHGMERHPGLATITVSAHKRGSRLHLAVHSSLGRLEPAEAEDGVGLGNLRRRLQLAHGADTRLELLPREGGGVSAIIELPCVC